MEKARQALKWLQLGPKWNSLGLIQLEKESLLEQRQKVNHIYVPSHLSSYRHDDFIS